MLRLDRTERQQLGVAAVGDRLCAVEALFYSRWIGREEQVAPVGLKPQLGAKLLAVKRAEAVGRDATGKNLDGPLRIAGHVAGQVGAGGGDEIDPWQRRMGNQSRTAMAQIGAVQRKRVNVGWDDERGPGG